MGIDNLSKKKWRQSKEVKSVKSVVQRSKKGIIWKKYEYEEIIKQVEVRNNSIGMRFVKIAGSKTFYLGQYTITQRQWVRIMHTRPWEKDYRVKKGNIYPATCISWNDCQEFIKQLNHKEGISKYRLPTSNEWEYACRAGSKTKYYYGDDVRRLGEYAWCCKNASLIEGKYPHKVGQKRPNRWGLYDMHGNVWEWCQDEWGSSLVLWYHKYRVIRGGHFAAFPSMCTSKYKNGGIPDQGHINYGFRLVRSL